VRIRNFFDNAYVFLGLYVTTFFSVSRSFLIFATRQWTSFGTHFLVPLVLIPTPSSSSSIPLLRLLHRHSTQTTGLPAKDPGGASEAATVAEVAVPLPAAARLAE
jgi:hypothetical protein